ncbi:hypothetical protein IAT40_001543 [Kwoniella sp. CBS 6097]
MSPIDPLDRLVSIGSAISGGPIFLELAAADVPTDPADQAERLEAGLKALMEPHLGLFLGPVMIGLIADLVLFGVMLKQLGMWWEYAREDRWFIKSIVTFRLPELMDRWSFWRQGWCAVFGVIGSVFNIAFVFHTFVYNYGRHSTIADSSWSSWLGVIAPLTSAGVQLFYTDRAYKLSGKNKPLALLIFSAILISVIGGIGSKITTVSNGDPSTARKATIFIYLYTAGAVGADFIITSSIMYCLVRSKTGWVVTDKVVNKLMQISAETQLPPTLMAIVFLIIFAYKTTKAAAHPGEVIIDVTSNLTGFFMMVMPKTYIVGFFAVLNARTALRAVFSSSNEPSQRKQNTYPLVNRNGQSGVQVTTEIYTQAENVHENNQRQRGTVYRTSQVPYDEESMGRIDPSEMGSKTGLTWSDSVKA